MLQKPVQNTTQKELLRTILERLLFVSLLVTVLIILGMKARAVTALVLAKKKKDTKETNG